jgi:uncharacterized membrane protein YjgN (DUF898 family)
MRDYTQYTYSELKQVYKDVDREKYPEVFQKIVDEMNRRKEACSRLYDEAYNAYENEKDLYLALTLFQQVVSGCPDSPQSRNASAYIRHIRNKIENISSEARKKHEMELRFTGTSREYFRIWIVNLCLTLLTFGIFSAWAKVRKKRYIYSHLILDDTPFQYLARPIPILKGRIIAAVLFLWYYSSSHFFTGMLPYIFVIGIALAPFVFIQSVGFNCRYSAYRNLTFHFEGKYIPAFKVLSAWGIIPVFVVGMIFDFWGIYWIPAICILAFTVLFAWWVKNIKQFTINHTFYGGQAGLFEATGGMFFRIYFVSGLILIPFTVVTAIIIITGVPGIGSSKYLPYILSIPTYVGYVFAYAYVKANITNAVWNHIKIGPIFFNCTLKTLDLVKLYLTNAFGIICSVGLLIPWAVIRTINYRVEHTQVINPGDLTVFKGSQQRDVRATGAELTEFFDMDLSI